MEKTLIVDLRQQLPDLHLYSFLDPKFKEYGRLSILENGTYWVGNIQTSHPMDTKVGFYWAIGTNGNLYISPRSNIIDKKYITNTLIKYLIKVLRLRYNHFKIIKE